MHATHKESNKVYKYTYLLYTYMPIYARLSNYIIYHTYILHILYKYTNSTVHKYKFVYTLYILYYTYIYKDCKVEINYQIL